MLHLRCDRRIQAGELHQLSLRPGHIFTCMCDIHLLCWPMLAHLFVDFTFAQPHCEIYVSRKVCARLTSQIRLKSYIVSDSSRKSIKATKCLLHSTTEGSTSMYTMTVGSLREALFSRSLAYGIYSCALWAARHLQGPRENKAERGCENTSLFTAPFPLLFGLYIRASAAGLSSTVRLHCDQCCPQLKRPAHIPFLPFHFYMAADRGC